MAEKPKKLHLGSCGGRKLGFWGVDIQPDDEGDSVDEVVDLNRLPWPWPDNSIEAIHASNVLEHLAPLGPSMGQLNIAAVMSEIYRIMQPGAVVEILVPSTDGRGAWQDPTHVTYWNRNTFLYFIKGEQTLGGKSFAESGYPQFVANRRDLGITDGTDMDLGIIYTGARLMKPFQEESTDGSSARGKEGADFEG